VDFQEFAPCIDRSKITKMKVFMKLLLCLILLLFLAPAFPSEWNPPKPGFVVHFDFISNAHEGRELVKIAAKAGAKVINVVPPAHIWENRQALEMLDEILDEIKQHHLYLVFTRIDAAFPPVGNNDRDYYLFSKILDEKGIMPDGSPTLDYFRTTAGRDGYQEWMEEETRYYGQHFGKLPNLIGINLGPFSEPFSSERGSLLQYANKTGSYEIAQYTSYALKLWHKWLLSHYGSIAAINSEYGTAFSSLDMVPMPLNELDGHFVKPTLAYFDFAQSLNDWFVDCYQRCRKIWHESSGRQDVPFILQLAGGEPEKIMRGRPGFAAFDMPGWIGIADAVGLSLYTNSGFPDKGHASINAAVSLASVACLLGKDVFVLEGGNEAPNVTLDPIEFQYFGSVARSLNPRTYIYEFLKDKFLEDYPYNPGKIVTAKGTIRRPAFNALKSMFAKIETTLAQPVKPALYVIANPMMVRGNIDAGLLNSALYDLSTELPILWIPFGTTPTLDPSIPVVQLDGAVSPSDENLSRLFRKIPPIYAPARIQWRQDVAKALRHF
jgi:hypothetical protein